MTSTAKTTADMVRDVAGVLPNGEQSARRMRLVDMRRASVWLVAGVLVVLYLSYVVHFGTNEPLYDEWGCCSWCSQPSTAI